jgi:hypothetical protein
MTRTMNMTMSMKRTRNLTMTLSETMKRILDSTHQYIK